MNDIVTKKTSPGKGFFTATPLEFLLDGKTYTYKGRGRWSTQLATKVVGEGKAPERSEDGWKWRSATESELAAAEKLVAKIAKRIREKNEAVALKLANKIAKKGVAPTMVNPEVTSV
jgi:hypothetical protein